MTRAVFVIAGFGLTVTLCLGLMGCSRSNVDPPVPAPTTVVVSYPVERNVTDYADFTGRTAAVDSVEVRARVSGYLDKVNFKEGSLVKKGDVLYVIDPRPFVAELNRAKAQFEESKASLTQSTAQLAQAQAQVNKADASLDYERRRLDRSRKLVPGNVITQEEFELQQSEMLQTQADVEAAKAQVGSSHAAIGTAKAAVQAAEAAVAVAELNLAYTNVTAPVSGRVSRTMVTEGNLVQSGDQTGGSLLTTLVSVDPMYAYFDVDEGTVLRVRQLIREGKVRSARDVAVPVLLGLGNEQDFPQQGTVNFVDNQVNPRTGTLRLRGVFPNAKEVLAPGYFARIRFPIGPPHQALLVDERALDTDQGQKILYVVNEKNKVVSRAVAVGERHDGLLVIDKGLKPGERVVVNGLQQVRPGVTVEAKLVEMPTEVASSQQTDTPQGINPKRSTSKPEKS